MRLGILGGTFDPIHIGHLIMAEEARIQLGLERVLFMPAGQPWMRRGTPVTPARHRVEMVRRAIAGNPHFSLSLMEVERPGDTYTVDTLRALRQEYGEGWHLHFILGADALEQLPLWKEPREIIRLCTLVAMARPGYDKHGLSSLEAVLPGLSRSLVWLREPQIGISSTEIRRRVAQGLSIRYWVPPAVEEYIMRHRLYAGSSDD